MKLLLNNEDDFKKWIKTIADSSHYVYHQFGNIETIENFFGIRFGLIMEDGTTQIPDMDSEDMDDWFLDQTDINPDVFVVTEKGGVPASYPCIAECLFERGFDRMGSTEIRMCEYIYLKDFTDPPKYSYQDEEAVHDDYNDGVYSVHKLTK